MCLSDPHTAVARTRISTSACPGLGTGTVFTSVASRPGAALVLTTAVIVAGMSPAGRRGEDFVRRRAAGRGLNSISRLIVAHVARASRRGDRSGRAQDVHRADVPRHDAARAADAQLLEEEGELLLERVADCLSGSLGQVPELLLEGADRILARLVEELALRLSLLPVFGLVVEEPALRLALERQWK